MKQVLLDLQSGSIQVEDVPAPTATRGAIVQNAYSLISAGTESSLINLAGQSLVGKAKARPDDVKKVLQKIGTDGPLPATGRRWAASQSRNRSVTAVPGRW